MDEGKREWGLHAKFVQSVVPAGQWSDDAPFDIARALGIEKDDATPRPVIMLSYDGRALPFLAFGKLVFRQLDLDLVQPIPAVMRDPARAQLVSGLVLEESKPPLLVLDTALLLSMAEETLPI
jgi:hypothetical protein